MTNKHPIIADCVQRGDYSFAFDYNPNFPSPGGAAQCHFIIRTPDHDDPVVVSLPVNLADHMTIFYVKQMTEVLKLPR